MRKRYGVLQIDVDLMRNCFNYNPDTGALTWKIKPSRSVRIGDVAGGVNLSNGYMRVRVKDKIYQVHRVIWALVTGLDPGNKEVDHHDRNRANNKWDNLRLAPGSAENGQNRSIASNNTSGYTGVSWNKQTKKWVSFIRINYQLKFLGGFKDLGEAVSAYAEAKAKCHTFHPEVPNR